MGILKQHLTAAAVIIVFACAAGFSTAVDAAKETETKDMKKILVVYYSRTGNTEKVAKEIAKATGADIEKLIDKKDRSGAFGYLGGGKDASSGNLAELEAVKIDPSKYDLVIIGTPIWAWTMTPAVRTYITEHKKDLKSIALFTTSASTAPEKTVKKMEELAGKKTVVSTGFVEKEINGDERASYDKKMKSFIDGCK